MRNKGLLWRFGPGSNSEGSNLTGKDNDESGYTTSSDLNSDLDTKNSNPSYPSALALRNLTHLIIVPCHGIWTGSSPDQVFDARYWILDGYMYGGEGTTIRLNSREDEDKANNKGMSTNVVERRLRAFVKHVEVGYVVYFHYVYIIFILRIFANSHSYSFKIASISQKRIAIAC